MIATENTVASLVTCPHCKKEISRAAYICPHCEYVSMDAFALHGRRLGWLGAGLLIVAVALGTIVSLKFL
jgi:hypothetical protein